MPPPPFPRYVRLASTSAVRRLFYSPVTSVTRYRKLAISRNHSHSPAFRIQKPIPELPRRRRSTPPATTPADGFVSSDMEIPVDDSRLNYGHMGYG